MLNIWAYSIISVLLVSFISLFGLVSLSVKAEKLKTFLIYLVSFSAGALFGDVFIHLLPEVSEEGFPIIVSISALGGILLFFGLEKIVHWQHCHMPITKGHVHSFAYMNLIGDMFHNFLDGVIIGVSYLVSIPTGIATTVAVVLHEIPQEIGDFGVLIHGGFSRAKALSLNFLTALTALLGAVIALVLSGVVESIILVLVPVAAGGFIYIAGSDLIPELHKEVGLKKGVLQLIAFLAGIGVMFLLILLD